jgi:hypothetical protein
VGLVGFDRGRREAGWIFGVGEGLVGFVWKYDWEGERTECSNGGLGGFGTVRWVRLEI